MVILLAATLVFAQQSGQPTKPEMQSYVNQAKQNSSQFDSILQELIARNASSGDINAYLRLKAEIDQLESRIKSQEYSIRATHERDNKVSPSVLNGLSKLIETHKKKVAEIDAIVQRQK